MLHFLGDFQFDQPSFWLGFLAGILTWWLLRKLVPVTSQFRDGIGTRLQSTQKDHLSSAEVRNINATLRQAESMHLAATLFSLDEILVEPRLMAPAPPVEPNLPPPYGDITDRVLPYLPDWPELAAVFRAPTLTLAEALQGNANLAIIGRPGSGKTVALAYLAIQIARRDPQFVHLASSIPILVHAADLNLSPQNTPNPLASLVDAVSSQASASSPPGFIQSAFEYGRALLLLDGLDELSPPALGQTVQYLNGLLKKYPGLRVVAAASSETYDGLTSIGFIPLAIAAWDADQQAAFIKQWGERWTRLIAAGSPVIDPLLLNGWLSNDNRCLTPLDLTLKLWSACEGNARGPRGVDAIEAYISRITGQPGHSNTLSALQYLAAEMTLSMQPVMTTKAAEQCLSQFEPGSIENELVVHRRGSRLAFCHPAIAGYLAAQGLLSKFSIQPECAQELLGQPEWTGKSQALHYLAALDPSAGWLSNSLLEAESDLLMRPLFKAARWLGDASESSTWRLGLLRQLAGCLQDKNLCLGIRARALAGLVLSRSEGIPVMLRQSLSSSDPHLRGLASLGCGFLHDAKAVYEMSALLIDPLPFVRDAASLGLVAVGDQAAMETVASALLNGDEGLRRSAAEALANHLEEGHPALEEGSTLEDVLVRRAVVHGLLRVRRPWAVETLKKMRTDSQWVIQNAATQALESMARPDPHIPRRLPALPETPWLIAFAAKYGMGVAPGKPAIDLLLQSLKDGTEEERLAALHVLSRDHIESAIPLLYQAYYSSEGDLREAALNTIWHYAAAGINLPQV